MLNRWQKVAAITKQTNSLQFAATTLISRRNHRWRVARETVQRASTRIRLSILPSRRQIASRHMQVEAINEYAISSYYAVSCNWWFNMRNMKERKDEKVSRGQRVKSFFLRGSVFENIRFKCIALSARLAPNFTRIDVNECYLRLVCTLK